jgi:membrane protease subunit (stomatin/prohibitin family)
VENISVPPEVELALDKKTSMGVVGNLAAYTQFNVADSIPDAAKNPGGTAATGAGIGFGITMASSVGKSMSPDAPPPIPGSPMYFAVIDGKQNGPFDQQGLASQVSSGKLTAQTLVWTHGMANWVPTAQVPAVAAILADVPPPIPPQS